MIRHRLTLVVVALVLAGGAAAIAIAGPPALRSLNGADATPHVTPMVYSQTSDHVPGVTTGTPAQRIKAIVARAGVSTIDSASLVQAPAAQGRAAGYALNLHVRIPAYGPTALKALWEAEVTQGAIAESLAYTHANPLVNSTITGDLPNGQQVALPSGGGNVAAGQTYSSASDDAIKTSIASAVSSAGLSLTSVSILRADQPAPAVVVQAQDQQDATAQEAALTRALFFRGTSEIYEGYYLEFDDPSGKPLIIDRASLRTGTTGRWSTADEAASGQNQP